jgi:DNA-binding MarR family transcriptional regulator
LDERGYLERVLNKDDRRSFNLKITLEGRKAHDRYIATEREFLKKLLHALRTSEERQRLVSLLHNAALNIP